MGAVNLLCILHDEAPLLEGQLGFDLGFGDDAVLGGAGGGAPAADLTHHHRQSGDTVRFDV